MLSIFSKLLDGCRMEKYSMLSIADVFFGE